MRLFLALPLLAALLAGAPSGAAPRVPADDAEVIERVADAGSASDATLRARRAELAQHPDDAGRAFAFARQAIRVARTTGDPRPLGQAEAALAPFLADPTPLAEALVLGATLRQGRHDFAGARADLDRALALAPRHAEARLSRASIALAEGRPRAARPDCAALLSLGARLEGTACLALVAGLEGRASAARDALARELAASDPPDASLRRFALLALADLAEVAGDASGAEAALAAALALPEPDVAVRAAYADLLLATGRAAEVRRQLATAQGEGDALRSDALLLRAYLAARALGDADAEALAARLEGRFAMLRARGEAFHAREEARFRLAAGDAKAALALARANFAVQREPVDALLLIEAGRAAGDATAAEPVRAWMRDSGVGDPRLVVLESAR